jgi:5-formyltetrahydrofolate cyclo-ligase
MDPATRRTAQASLIEQLLGLAELARPDEPAASARIGMYLATDGEVDPSSAAEQLEARGWQVLLPVIGPARSMSFAPWSPGSPVVENRFGVAEPAHDDADLVAADALRVVVVPCVAVDRSGHRIGFGAGYYDRALADASATLRVGVAFEVQVVDRIRPEPWDVPLDVVVTEAGVLRPGE